MKKIKGDIVSIIVIIILCIAFVFLADCYSPLIGDYVDGAVFPMYWVAKRIRNGEVPFWFNNLWSGMPAVGNTLLGVFYPVNLLGALFISDKYPFLFMAVDLLINMLVFTFGIYFFARSVCNKWHYCLTAVLLICTTSI